MDREVLESVRTQLARIATSGDTVPADMIAETLEFHATPCHICFRDKHN